MNIPRLTAASALALILLAACADRQARENRGLAHGEIIRIENYTVPGQYTVFDFYSVHCPACMQLAPGLERLDVARRDLSVVKIDVDRPGSQAIDWMSPIARQYELSALPHLKIYDKNGRLETEGDAAIDQILKWIAQLPSS